MAMLQGMTKKDFCVSLNHLQQKLQKMNRVTQLKLGDKNTMLMTQNTRMKQLRLDKEELDFVLMLIQTHKLPNVRRRLLQNFKDLKKTAANRIRDHTNLVSDRDLLEQLLSSSKERLFYEEGISKDSQQIEKLLKKRLKLMEQILEWKTKQLCQEMMELDKVRNEFDCLIKQLRSLQDLCVQLDGIHINFFAKLQNMSKGYLHQNYMKHITGSKIEGIKDMIQQSRSYFDHEMNEIDRQSSYQLKFDQFIVAVGRSRDWYSQDCSLKILNKLLHSRKKQIRENQKAILLLRRMTSCDSIFKITADFKITCNNNFSLFRFLVYIHGEIQMYEVLCQFEYDKNSASEGKYVGEKALLRDDLKCLQKKVYEIKQKSEREVVQVEVMINTINDVREMLKDIVVLLAGDVTEDNDPFVADFPRKAVVDIHRRIRRILKIYKSLKVKRPPPPNINVKPYEIHYHDVIPPSAPPFE